MDLFEASILAKELIGTYLPHYKFAFDSKKNVNGSCHYNVRTIYLSRHLTQLRTKEAVTKTIYHEIAHGLTQGNGHGKLWQNQMRKFGYVPERCSSDVVDKSSISNWKAVCRYCGKTYYMVRSPRVKKCCGVCSKGKWDAKYTLTFKRM